MPCQYDMESEVSTADAPLAEARKRLDETTALLCTACDLLDNRGTIGWPDVLKAWHQKYKADAQLQYERERNENNVERRRAHDALAALELATAEARAHLRSFDLFSR